MNDSENIIKAVHDVLLITFLTSLGLNFNRSPKRIRETVITDSAATFTYRCIHRLV